MTGWLNLTDEQRRNLLIPAQQRTGMGVKALEKDWWVTLVLKALFQSRYANYMVFKGGTSLSKGWKLVTRFSEDIDIALDPAVFGMPYLEKPSKGYRDKLKREGCKFTSTVLLEELSAQLIALGAQKEILAVTAEPVPENRPDTDPQTLYIRYRSLYEPNKYIVDEVRIEVSVRSLRVPFSIRPIISILAEVNPNKAYAEEPFDVAIVEPRKTFLEKSFLLHEEFGKPDKTKIRHTRMSRHFYDLVMNMDGEHGAAALADHELYEALIRHREAYMHISWVDYNSLEHATLAFVPPPEMLDLFRSDYEQLQETMIYGEAPPFEQIIERMKLLQGRYRLKMNGRSLEEIIEKAKQQVSAEDTDIVSTTVVYLTDAALPEEPGNMSEKYQVDFARQGKKLVFESITILSE